MEHRTSRYRMVVIFLATILHSNGILSASAEAFQHLSPAVMIPKILAAAGRLSRWKLQRRKHAPAESTHGFSSRVCLEWQRRRNVRRLRLGATDAFRRVPPRPAEHDRYRCEARLVFSNRPISRIHWLRCKVKHVDIPGATTFAGFAPVTARYVRWQVTAMLPGRSPNVGGQSIECLPPAKPEAAAARHRHRSQHGAR